MPDKEALLIIVNGNTVTKLVPFGSCRIDNERGNRVSSADMVIQNGASLGLAELQTVIIYSQDLSLVHFQGYISDLSSDKDGLQIDYSLTCQSNEMRMQKAIVTGTYTGTEDVILSALLAATYPDLSDLFDFSSGVTPSAFDLSLPLSDSTLLDALNSLSALAGNAPYNFDNDDSARLNIILNPALTNNMNHYGGTIPIDSAHYDAGWTPGNVSWDAAAGETGGGIEIAPPQVKLSGYESFWRIGRALDSDPIDELFFISRGDNQYLNMTFRVNHDNTDNCSIQVIMLTYTEDGVFFGQVAAQDNFVPAGWHSWGDSGSHYWDLSDPATIPESGWCEFSCTIWDNTTATAFTTQLDSFILETVYTVGTPALPAYFDGDSSGASWLGTAHNSVSSESVMDLTWGTSPPAPFDVDIGTGTEIFENLHIDYNGFNSINSIIVSTTEWLSIDWEYEGNGNAADYHFDLEIPIYPMDTIAFPEIYKNTGDDTTPNWVPQTVATPQDGFAAGNVLYDLERHWVEFAEAPDELKRSWRIVGRYKRAVRAIVTDDDSINESGVELTDILVVEDATVDQAYDLGQAELENRKPSMTVEYDTYDPGIIAGMEQTVIDSSQDVNETLIVERVTRNYIGGGYVYNHVELGKYPAGLDDILYENYQDNRDRVPIGTDIEQVTISEVIDEDDSPVIDEDGAIVIDIG